MGHNQTNVWAGKVLLAEWISPNFRSKEERTEIAGIIGKAVEMTIPRIDVIKVKPVKNTVWKGQP